LTIATPHGGSPYANWVVRKSSLPGRAMNLAGRLGLDLGAIHDLTTEACARFNEDIPDHPTVKYFSISACHPGKKMPPWALHSHKIIQKSEGDNDGLVSVASARHGHHLGTWQADHWQTINRRFLWLMMNPSRDITPQYLRALDKVIEAAGSHT
jgi:triacylglycerol lipase